jgi:AAA+ ATPase superfamily predicted ATPase
MNFLDRKKEWRRLDLLRARNAAGLVAVWGRRRVGKTRLLTEWCRQNNGLYTVADQSAAAVQRRYFAETVGQILQGIADVEYPDWRSLFRRISKDAQTAGWHGPLVIDELPYWVMADPTLPSLLQNWVDEEARSGGLLIVVAGSSQRMMQGLLLDAAAPLYGRAQEMLDMQPLPAGWLGEALRIADPVRQVEAYAVWGGIPRYWELAEPFGDDLEAAVDALVLDPMGPLHREPDRLLLEETPSAAAVRPLLDVIGGGAHRLTEIAARLAQPATALARPLSRLIDLGLVCRETPYGEPEKNTKRSLYRIADPFFLFWFQVVAPRRAMLAQAPRQTRIALWRNQKSRLESAAWENLCRAYVSRNPAPLVAGDTGWLPAKRWWQGKAPELDIVSTSMTGNRLLIGEAKWSTAAFSGQEAARLAAALETRPVPACLSGEKKPVLFLPALVPRAAAPPGGTVQLITAAEVMAVIR